MSQSNLLFLDPLNSLNARRDALLRLRRIQAQLGFRPREQEERVEARPENEPGIIQSLTEAFVPRQNGGRMQNSYYDEARSNGFLQASSGIANRIHPLAGWLANGIGAGLLAGVSSANPFIGLAAGGASLISGIPSLWSSFKDRKAQQEIAQYLDLKCFQIDSVIMKQQAVIEKLKEYKISFVTEAVTKGLNKNVPLIDSGTAWMGNVPVGWKKYRIANLYDQTAISGREDLPILTVSINSGISDSELDEAEQERQFVRSEDRTKYKRVRPGDLVYNMMRAWQGAFPVFHDGGLSRY